MPADAYPNDWARRMISTRPPTRTATHRARRTARPRGAHAHPRHSSKVRRRYGIAGGAPRRRSAKVRARAHPPRRPADGLVVLYAHRAGIAAAGGGHPRSCAPQFPDAILSAIRRSAVSSSGMRSRPSAQAHQGDAFLIGQRELLQERVEQRPLLDRARHRPPTGLPDSWRGSGRRATESSSSAMLLMQRPRLAASRSASVHGAAGATGSGMAEDWATM